MLQKPSSMPSIVSIDDVVATFLSPIKSGFWRCPDSSALPRLRCTPPGSYGISLSDSPHGSNWTTTLSEEGSELVDWFSAGVALAATWCCALDSWNSRTYQSMPLAHLSMTPSITTTFQPEKTPSVYLLPLWVLLVFVPFMERVVMKSPIISSYLPAYHWTVQ